MEPGFARKLREQLNFNSPEDMLTQDMMQFWVMFSQFVTLSIAEVENRHARNARRSNPNSTFAQFAASFVNQEACVLARAKSRLIELVRQRMAPAQTSQSIQNNAPFVRAQTAFELFRKDLINRDAMMGKVHHVASAEFWAHTSIVRSTRFQNGEVLSECFLERVRTAA